ncbi:MAG TPA: immune inhibitor A domain-containing protein, partial [Candidatus Edwardsbacteria bacterium]|nr:immune inhibitor A domain-containing protein [Candidatus Edwardsbacteria bacterium]
ITLTSGEGNITKCIAVPQNAQLGVFCHELFHQATGGPDLYDYGYSGTPWGEWSLMDNGSWNGIPSGAQPSFVGGHLCYDCDGAIGTGVTGWLTQTDSISSAKNGDGKYTICALDSAGAARQGYPTSGIRLWRVRNNNFRDSGQVFFVELRRRTPPYEMGLPEDGLIISHLDTRMGGGTRFNDGPPTVRDYYSWVEQPGFDPNPLYSSGDSIFTRSPANACYSADDVSPGGYTESRIDSTSVPNSWINKSYTSTAARTGPWIYDVSREGPVMTFNVLRTGLASANPLISFQTATVLDPATPHTVNNNNGLLDPWETDSLKIAFLNGGTAAITAGARCSLYVVSGSQYVYTPPVWQTVGGGAVGAGAQAVSAPFVLWVSRYTPRLTDILFGVKFTSTSPAVTDTSYFTLRVSPYQIVFTYDFANIDVGAANYGYRLQPSDLAVYQDTLYVANADINHATWYTRIYKVKKTTANNPLVGGVGGDTISSLPNRGTAYDANKYVGGIDVDNSGNLWYSVQDSCFNVTRATPTPTVLKKFRFPNVSWGGTPMKRVRGVALGPSVVDTVGGSAGIPGDSLWGYWQNYFDAAAAGSGAESLYVMRKVATGTSTIAYRYGFQDSAWGAQSYPGNGYSWWNGRALEYTGSDLLTSSVWLNLLIKRDARNGRVTMVMPGPSSFGSYGTYGIAHEATDAAGTPYAPVGSAAYVPYHRGTIHYLYCASMDEGKIYKILATDFFVPTPCDSVKASAMSATVNKVKFWKHDADTQKVQGYIIFRRDDTNAPDPAADSIGFVQSSRSGSAVATVDSFMDNGAKGGKAPHYYTVIPVNYSGAAGFGVATGSDEVLGVSLDGPRPAPPAYALAQNSPNPMGAGGTMINYALKAPGRTSLRLYNVLGQAVRTLVDGYQQPARYAVKWDGRDDGGRPVANGIYFYRLSSGDFRSNRRLTLVR